MSDCRTTYRKVKEFVQCLYPSKLRGNLYRNMNTLTAMITGIIIGKETQLPQIATNVPELIKLTSTEKRFKRLIINKNLVGRGCICLMISLIYKSRALPLAFTVVKGKKGHLPEDTHVELVNRLFPLIPESTKQVIFLGDGEFDGTTLQQTLTTFGWKYVSRTSYNITIYANGEPFQIEFHKAVISIYKTAK